MNKILSTGLLVASLGVSTGIVGGLLKNSYNNSQSPQSPKIYDATNLYIVDPDLSLEKGVVIGYEGNQSVELWEMNKQGKLELGVNLHQAMLDKTKNERNTEIQTLKDTYQTLQDTRNNDTKEMIKELEASYSTDPEKTDSKKQE